MGRGVYRTVQDLPQVIPVFPLDGALMLPGGPLPLQIFEPRYLSMFDDALAGDRLIGMIQTRPGGDAERPHLAQVGTVGKITSFSETADGRYLVTLTGLCRFRVRAELPVQTPYRQVQADYADYGADFAEDDEEVEFDRVPFLALLRRYLEQRGLGIEWEAVQSAPGPALINSLAVALPFGLAEKQALLEAATVAERREIMSALLEIEVAGGAGDDGEPPSLQ